MAKAIVMKISEKNKALVMMVGGRFCKCTAEPSWRPGDVVTLAPEMRKMHGWKKAALMAACFALFVLSGVFYHSTFIQVSEVISVDVNPSIMLRLNRTGHVVGVEACNDDGMEFLQQANVKGLPRDEALRVILECDEMRPYLEQDATLVLSLCTNRNIDSVKTSIQQTLTDVEGAHPNLRTQLLVVTQDDVNKAHGLGVSPGKYSLLRTLQRLDPSVSIFQNKDKSVSALVDKINELNAPQPAALQAPPEPGPPTSPSSEQAEEPKDIPYNGGAPAPLTQLPPVVNPEPVVNPPEAPASSPPEKVEPPPPVPTVPDPAPSESVTSDVAPPESVTSDVAPSEPAPSEQTPVSDSENPV